MVLIYMNRGWPGMRAARLGCLAAQFAGPVAWGLAIFASRVARAYRRDHEGAGDAEARPAADGTAGRQARRLGACYDIADLRRAAKRRIPRPVFDYVDGAADEEISVAANVAAFRSWRFLPRVLAGVESADTSAPVLGSTLPAPMVLAPTGYTRMLHPDGEIGAARSAFRHGLPYTLSTMATTGIEELRASVGGAGRRLARGRGPRGWLWFQLYLTRDRAQAYDLVDRAALERVHGAGGHRGHGRGREPGAGPAQRPVDPAGAHPEDGRLGRRQARLLVPAAVGAAARLRQLRRGGRRRR